MDSLWSAPEVIRFYRQGRSRPEELYPSERKILLPIAPRCQDVLDVGCAVGGFFPILRSFNSRIRYTGIDVSPEMIDEARGRYPQAHFETGDGVPLPFPENSFDLALSTGVLHHNPNYQEMIREIYRVARRGCVLDLPRLVTVPYAYSLDTSHMSAQGWTHKADFGREERDSLVPYLLEHPHSMFSFLLNELEPRPAAIAAAGYYGSPGESTVLPVRRVCFCVIFLKKGDSKTRDTVFLTDLPEEIAGHIPKKAVNWVSGAWAELSNWI